MPAIAGYGAQKLPRQLASTCRNRRRSCIRSDRAPVGQPLQRPECINDDPVPGLVTQLDNQAESVRNRVQNQDDAMFSRTWLISGDQTLLAYC